MTYDSADLGAGLFSLKSGHTHRLVTRLGLPFLRIPMKTDRLPHTADRFELICPTYADGEGRGAVPKQVIRFLNDPTKRAESRGVIGTGNRNFGVTHALAGRITAQKCNVPLLYSFELAGANTDIARVRAGLEKLGDIYARQQRKRAGLSRAERDAEPL
ncbi:class Ib ribonucleoside-diphosphate reductase assembly flavoprotein NrdI [Ruegeria sp. SCP11]|uniref:class Ib ribonucleoside-diphosphate reductase assembly flavoprotein NrdI n=1 Tax=Ruegeria sp. SCP11 TaxID=3141378 RepID=UPI0033359EFD